MCHQDFDPVWNVSFEDEYRSIPRETWQLCKLAPLGSAAWDDGSHVLMVVTDKVRVFGAKTVETPKGIEFFDFAMATVDIETFREALTSAIAWADACPPTTRD